MVKVLPSQALKTKEKPVESDQLGTSLRNRKFILDRMRFQFFSFCLRRGRSRRSKQNWKERRILFKSSEGWAEFDERDKHVSSGLCYVEGEFLVTPFS